MVSIAIPYKIYLGLFIKCRFPTTDLWNQNKHFKKLSQYFWHSYSCLCSFIVKFRILWKEIVLSPLLKNIQGHMKVIVLKAWKINDKFICCKLTEYAVSRSMCFYISCTILPFSFRETGTFTSFPLIGSGKKHWAFIWSQHKRIWEHI